jgi:phenylpropionate dioxygenase-like ring-hydroxylating dioxygenase large terminal subunit
MAVCRYDSGNTASFTCPYHAWSYDLDGKLTGVPRSAEGYGDALNRTEWGLIRARVAVFYGSIWATFNQKAPAFDEYLGETSLYLRDLLQGPDGEDDGYEVIGGILKWRIPCNWKFGAENFSGDTYHGFSHRSVDRLGISLSGKKGRHAFAGLAAPYVYLSIADPKRGHTFRANLYKEAAPYESMWGMLSEVDDYYRLAHEKRQRRLGDRARLYLRGGIIFPGMHFNAGGRETIGVWMPAGPSETEVWRWMFVPKNAPEIVKDSLRHYYLRYAGPGGMTEQDDMENWTAAHRGTQGVIARQFPFNYQLARGREKPAPEAWLGKELVVTEGVSEHNQRTFYEAWARLMDTEPDVAYASAEQ